MNAEHYNELIELSQKIYDQSTDTLSNYLSAHYCGVDSQSNERQLEDYLFVAEETAVYLLGNALALLDADTQEEEIKTFMDNLRKVIKYAQEKARNDTLPS